MAKPHKPQIEGLDSLGARLRDLRLKAGISQMKLAEMLGLNPNHGYKYILRLEKGLIPNPTLRTITTFLVACGASWQDIVDVLPALTTSLVSKKEHSEPEPIIVPPTLTALPYLEGDLRTWLQQLKTEKPKEKTFNPLTTKQFWELVKKAQNQAWELLRLSRQTTTSRRGYLSFIRSLCGLLALTVNEEKAQHAGIERIFNQAVKQGLDPELLKQIQRICLELFSPGS